MWQVNNSVITFVHTEAGFNHTNEDSVLMRPHPEQSEMLLCALTDGQGGRAGGAAASRLAVEESLQAASSFSVEELFQPPFWYRIVSAADEAVCEDDEAGFCTLVNLCITEREVCGASCGDSGALLLSGGQELLLTEDQQKNPPIGSSAAQPVAFSARLQPSWKLLIVSDGIWRYVGWNALSQIAAEKQGQELLASLRQAATEAGGGTLHDDFSIVLLQSANSENRF